jgi:2-haloacid dehalogenase
MRLKIGGIETTVSSLWGTIPSALLADPRVHSSIKAIAFDAFPVFDPKPVFSLVNQLFPGKGADLSNEWRTRQFEYTWLRVVDRHYADFWQVTEQALIFAANKLKLELGQDQRNKLMNAYLELKAWQDVVPDPRAYQLGVDALRLKREEILFVAFAGWDATGDTLSDLVQYLA